MQQIIAIETLPMLPPLRKNPYAVGIALFSGRYCRDRFNVLNKYCDINWIDTVDPIPERTDRPISDFMNERAVELIKKGSVAVQWSGGVDSTALTTALMQNGIDPQDLEILYDDTSVKEYPWFYETYSKNWNFKKVDDWYKELGNNSADFIVNGWCADQLFGSVFFHEHSGLYMKPIEHFSKILTGISFTKDEQTKIIEEFKSYGKNILDVELNTLADLGWFINFTCKWTYVSAFNNLYLSDTKNRSKTLVFYDTPGFQSWSLSNFENVSKINIYDPEHPEEYKKALKKYVYSFTKDEDFLKNKGKNPSWNSMNNSTMYRSDRVIVKSTKGYTYYYFKNRASYEQILQSIKNIE